jgi:hypothetical protein
MLDWASIAKQKVNQSRMPRWEQEFKFFYSFWLLKKSTGQKEERKARMRRRAGRRGDKNSSRLCFPDIIPAMSASPFMTRSEEDVVYDVLQV